MKKTTYFILGILMLSSCSSGNNSSEKESNSEYEEEPQPVRMQAVSLLGQDLYPREFSPEAQKRLTKNLNDAIRNFNEDSVDEMSIIWYGRRTAYMDQFKEAIAIYGYGIRLHPQSYKLYRHRGHRYISTREFDKAIADFNKASELSKGTEQEIEPDGIPNSINQPLSTTQWNIYYHLGLAHYLNGDFDKALEAYNTCYDMSLNNDVLVAITDWKYMTLRRMGQDAEAEKLLPPITDDMEIIENDSYFKRIKMYKGELPPDSLLNVDSSDESAALSIATQGYGVGNWYLYNGDTAKAIEVFEKVVEGNYWPAFGYIAAEADLARLKE